MHSRMDAQLLQHLPALTLAIRRCRRSAVCRSELWAANTELEPNFERDWARREQLCLRLRSQRPCHRALEKCRACGTRRTFAARSRWVETTVATGCSCHAKRSACMQAPSERQAQARETDTSAHERLCSKSTFSSAAVEATRPVCAAWVDMTIPGPRSGRARRHGAVRIAGA